MSTHHGICLDDDYTYEWAQFSGKLHTKYYGVTCDARTSCPRGVTNKHRQHVSQDKYLTNLTSSHHFGSFK